jgi:DNA-binding response OmpR family regulator
MRIPLVEDERKMAELICKGLSRENYSVMTAHTGPDGLDLALAYPFDAMILERAKKPGIRLLPLVVV